MDEEEALQVVRIMHPKFVIPCHYNVPALFTKKYCAADDKMFKEKVENMGVESHLMKYGDEIEV